MNSRQLNKRERTVEKLTVLSIAILGLLTLGMGTRQIHNPGIFAKYKLTTFQVSGQTQITVTGIDNAGDVVGNYVNGSSQTVGFERLANGTISNVVDPNDNHGFDRANGINNKGVISGDYAYNVGDSYEYSGFFYQSGNYTQYQVDGESTSNFGINDKGDFVGQYYDGSGYPGFVNVNGTVTQINVPDAYLTYPYSINNAGLIVGEWLTSSYVETGFAAKSNGTILGNLIYPGAADTIANSINNHDEIAGYYVDSAMNVHGFLYLKGKYTEGNIPGAAQTIALAINDNGAVCGSFINPENQEFGFIATPK